MTKINLQKQKAQDLSENNIPAIRYIFVWQGLQTLAKQRMPLLSGL